MSKVYISGKITGLPIEEAQAKFNEAETFITKVGDEPVNPLKICPYDPAFTWEHYMAEDLKALLTCQAIMMLDNWETSKGARIERAVAFELGLEIIYH